jgi:hypothetical protein
MLADYQGLISGHLMNKEAEGKFIGFG